MGLFDDSISLVSVSGGLGQDFDDFDADSGPGVPIEPTSLSRRKSWVHSTRRCDVKRMPPQGFAVPEWRRSFGVIDSGADDRKVNRAGSES